MRFFNLLKYDFLKTQKQMKRNCSCLFLINLFLLSLFICTMYNLHIFEIDSVAMVKQLSYSFGDIILYTYGGELPFYGQEKYELPLMCIAFQAVLCLFSLNYAKEDLCTSGMQIIVRVKSKTVWLLSKFIWNIATTILYISVIYVVFFLGAMLLLQSFTLQIHEDVFILVTGTEMLHQVTSETELLFALVIMPFVVSITLNLFQMTLTLFLKPIYSYFLTMLYIILGGYFSYKCCIFNFAMPVRSSVMGIYNFYPTNGIILCILISIFCFVVCVFKLKKINILHKTV